MERLRERIISAEKALISLKELVLISAPNPIERDAMIQRFEYTFEACWKTAKQYLFDMEGVDVGSPKGVIRSSREVNLFNDEETITALNMVNDRNLTVHTYNEEIAIKIQSSIKEYFILLENWIRRMKERIE
ncbi:HI0074 family nucleotidyltransferase substrate-binding subunit [Evansella sp. AB-P1]|uniref:HI0074 family nucleotidyltransferase substrate-binding subunit n=1 Tax=Evansella sp. AB-P1 TaxID=3037653 RepID=UPI00241CA942|nr:HI0074 family nucleotidyltransferase substrate-binding subunit [Evansella sp. AB-P1]MDG5789879.1 HI0074 family nucleotidyltransferase substrate-binding subunit [Evansella sp. AB-P1]